MKWYSVNEAAHHLGVSELYIRTLVNSGELESHTKPRGRGRLIPETALDALVMSWPSGSRSILDERR